MKSISLVPPREDVGRDTISRFDMQFQAAAYAALEILDGKGIDCVYCDYHDDFVVRRQVNGLTTYHFFQVKTKKKLNDQWDLAEIFAFKKRGQQKDEESLKKVRTSFAGRLLVHGIVFGDSCNQATLLSNVHFNDEVIEAVVELSGKAPKSKAATFLAENFSAIFTIQAEPDAAKVADALSKLSVRPAVSYINNDRSAFASAARTAIFNYSEIDLDFYETSELANGLIDLVYRKSMAPLEGVAPGDLESRVGVCLDDLLEVLSISRAAYDALLSGVDPKVLKTASVIQRWMKRAGASDEMIEFASQQKVNWDLWLRNARHIYAPFDLNMLLERIDRMYDQWVKGGADFSFLQKLLDELESDSIVKNRGGLARELLFGAVCSVVVRRYSK